MFDIITFFLDLPIIKLIIILTLICFLILSISYHNNN